MPTASWQRYVSPGLLDSEEGQCSAVFLLSVGVQTRQQCALDSQCSPRPAKAPCSLCVRSAHGSIIPPLCGLHGRKRSVLPARLTPHARAPRGRGSEGHAGGWGAWTPPCWGCALAAGAGWGSQPPVPGRATARRGELVAVFLLDVWLKVPVGRSELGCGRRGRQILVN